MGSVELRLLAPAVSGLAFDRPRLYHPSYDDGLLVLRSRTSAARVVRPWAQLL